MIKNYLEIRNLLKNSLDPLEIGRFKGYEEDEDEDEDKDQNEDKDDENDFSNKENSEKTKDNLILMNKILDKNIEKEISKLNKEYQSIFEPKLIEIIVPYSNILKINNKNIDEYTGEELIELGKQSPFGDLKNSKTVIEKEVRNSIEITENDQKLEFPKESNEFFRILKNKISKVLYNNRSIQFKLNKV
jgi:hypothetical protein